MANAGATTTSRVGELRDLARQIAAVCGDIDDDLEHLQTRLDPRPAKAGVK